MPHISQRNPGRRADDDQPTEGEAIDSDLQARSEHEQTIAPPYAEELERLYYLSCEPDLLRAAFERSHPIKAFFRRHPSLGHGLVLLALAAATIAAFVAASLSPLA